jgi:hypothetical protein
MSEACSECGGGGWVAGCRPEHAPGCTDTRCASNCPVPVETHEPCPCCGGCGQVPTLDDDGESR